MVILACPASTLGLALLALMVPGSVWSPCKWDLTCCLTIICIVSFVYLKKAYHFLLSPETWQAWASQDLCLLALSIWRHWLTCRFSVINFLINEIERYGFDDWRFNAINRWLGNNSLTGPIPDLSSLKMLETL